MMCGLRRSIVVSALLVMAWSFSGFSKAFNASVDKKSVAVGGSLRLTLEYDGQTNEEPELGPLEREFTILSRQTAQESSFVNGNHRSKTSWILEILPKSSAKTLTIPAIKLGQQSSAPIEIAQTEQNSQVHQGDIAVTMSTDRAESYITGEVILTVTIKTPLSLRNASLTKPEIKNAIVETLVEGERSEAVEQGIKYFMYKQVYAVYPSKSGELEIPPVIFRAIAVADRQSGQGLRGLFSNGSSVSMRSNSVSLHIKDVPAEFPKNQQFVAFKSFVIIDSFDEANPSFEVNKATSRRFEIKAKGGLASYLPNVATPTVKDLQVYSDVGTKVQKNEPDGIVSTAKFSHIYMPSATGTLNVPEQEIYWWNVGEDKLKVTSVRALTLNVTGQGVAPPPNQPAADAVPAPTDENIQPPPALTPKQGQPSASTNYWWQAISVVLLILWLSTLAVLLWRRRASDASHESVKSIEHQLKQRVKNIVSSCSSQDAKAVYRDIESFLWWVDRNRVVITNRTELALLRDDLEATLYRDQSGKADDVVSRIKRDVEQTRLAPPSSVLVAPLYPE